MPSILLIILLAPACRAPEPQQQSGIESVWSGLRGASQGDKLLESLYPALSTPSREMFTWSEVFLLLANPELFPEIPDIPRVFGDGEYIGVAPGPRTREEFGVVRLPEGKRRLRFLFVLEGDTVRLGLGEQLLRIKDGEQAYSWEIP